MFVRRALVFVFGGAAASPFVLDVHVDGARALARTLESYVSVDMDWWPDDGSEGGSWAQASVLTADLAVGGMVGLTVGGVVVAKEVEVAPEA